MHVLVVNQHGDNRGDEAAVAGMLTGLREQLGPIEVTVLHQLASDPAEVELPVPVEWLPLRLPVLEALRLLAHSVLVALRLPPDRIRPLAGPIGRRIVDAYRTADVVVSAPGGPYLGDPYKDHEPVHWAAIWLGVLHRRPLVLYAPSVGPFGFRPWNPFRRATFRRFRRVTVREQVSAGHLAELMGASFPVEVTTDAALQRSVPTPDRDGPFTLAVSAIDWRYPGADDPEACRRRYDAAVRAAIARVAEREGCRVVLLPQLHGPRHRDQPYLERLAAGLDPSLPVEVLSDREPSDAHRRAVAAADLVIAGRYHPAVFAVAAGTPVVCIPYEHKARGLMEAAGLGEFVLPIEDVTEARLVEMVDRMLDVRGEVAATLPRRAGELARLSSRTSEVVAEVVEGSRR